MKLDNIHFTFQKIDSYNKPFNSVISEREAGKTTAACLQKIYKNFKEGYTTVLIRRRIADITEVYINDIGEVINKFLDTPIKLTFKKGSIKEGVVDVFCEGQPFMRVVALSNPMSRIKSLIYPNLRTIIFDEFICNTKMGESYLSNETMRFRELYKTFSREARQQNINLKVYFLGNPYSNYNPYFAWWGVDYNKLQPGSFVSGSNWAIQCYTICEELKAQIIAADPLYEFDDSYRAYAFGGVAVNDMNYIIVNTQPESFRLRYILKYEDNFLEFFQGFNKEMSTTWWCQSTKDIKHYKTVVRCFDVEDLIEGSTAINREDKVSFYVLKLAIGNRNVSYKDIGAANMAELIYRKM